MLKKLLSYIYPIHLYKTDSEISKTIEVTLYNGELVLDTQNVNYSYGTLQRVLRFGLKKIGFDKIIQMQNILILGVAGGSVIKTLVDEIGYKGKIKGIELDASIIEVANKYFGLNQIPNLEIVIDDAQKSVKIETDKYDLIIVDIFQDREMPDFLFEKSFSDDLILLLKNKGIILFNTMKTSQKEVEQNQVLKMNYCQLKFDIFEFLGVEGSNDVVIIEKKS